MYQIISVQNKRLLRYARNDPSLIPPLSKWGQRGVFPVIARSVSDEAISFFEANKIKG